MRSLVLLILLLVSFAANAFQDDLTRRIQQEWSNYYQQKHPLKLHLFLNQPGYFPGDTIFYKASLVNAYDHSPLQENTILKVFLKNSLGNVVTQQLIRLKNGFGHNQLVIPKFLHKGVYSIIAYTDRQINFGPSHYFKKEIAVGEVNTPLDANKDLSFFVEGGNFVEGLNHKIVIRGRPNLNGTVHNATGAQIDKFSLDENGLGILFLTPSNSEKYFCKLDGAGSYPLPVLIRDGVGLSCASQADTSLKVVVQMPTGSKFRHERNYLVASVRGSVFYAANFQLNDKAYVTVNIPLKSIPSGVAQLALYNEENTILAERLVFIPPKNDLRSNISLDKNDIGTRQKVTATFQLSDSIGNGIRSNIAITVFNRNHFISTDNRNVVNDFLFYSELDQPDFKNFQWFKKPISYLSLDNYLITKKLIHNLSKNSNIEPKYFIHNLRFTGRVVSTSGHEIPDSSRITFFLQNSVDIYQAYVKNSAFDVFLLMDFYGKENVYYRIEHKGKKLEGAKIMLDQDSIRDIEADSKPTAMNMTSFSDQRTLINESYRFYATAPVYTTSAQFNSMIEEEVFGANIQVKLSDYKLFPTMEETLREIIPFVQHRKVKNKSIVRIYIKELDKFPDVGPLFIIDGVATDDSDYFMRLQPTDVSAIKVIHTLDKLRMFGDLGKGGIVLVETNIPDHAALMPKTETSFEAVGLNTPLRFKGIDHKLSRASRIPDLRTALYWSPDMVTDEKGVATISFYTTDVTGNYVIQVEGVTNEGKPFFEQETFEVKFKPASD